MATAVRHSLTGDLVKGAVAGAAGSWAMTKVTVLMKENQGEEVSEKEKQAQIDGKGAIENTKERIAEKTGMEVSNRQIHYAMGMLPGALYGVLLDRLAPVGFAKGLLYGAALFFVMDEVATPAVGVANLPSAYPWQTHARGLVGHLVLGAVTYRVFKLLNRW